MAIKFCALCHLYKYSESVYTVITVKETDRRKPEEVVEYDSSMYTEDDVRTIYSNMDKFYSSLAVSD